MTDPPPRATLLRDLFRSAQPHAERNPMSSSLEVGQKLVEFCRQGKNVEAVNTLYDPKIVSVETMKDPMFPQRIDGIDGVKKKNQWWVDNHQIHSAEAAGPFP